MTYVMIESEVRMFQHRSPECVSSTATRPKPSEEALATLMVASSRGDQVAFARLYDETAPCIYGLLLRLRPECAHELMVATYLEAWRSCRHYDAAEHRVRAWILNVVLHQVAAHPSRPLTRSEPENDDFPTTHH